jgi:hypothetical protein
LSADSLSDFQADALFCANDFTAAVLFRLRQSIGIRAPKAFCLVGFDGVKYATLVSPPMTTAHQPCRDIAVITFRTMLKRLAEPSLPARSIYLTPISSCVNLAAPICPAPKRAESDGISHMATLQWVGIQSSAGIAQLQVFGIFSKARRIICNSLSGW